MDNYIGDVRVVDTIAEATNYIGDIVVRDSAAEAPDFVGEVGACDTPAESNNYIGDVRIVNSKAESSNFFGDVVSSVLNPIVLPADYWQEEETDNYFIEEETGLILTLEDL